MVDVLGAMSSLGSAAINYKATMDSAAAAAEQAQKNRDFEMSMANKQRAEALADRAHSEMYNSPLMERMRREAAGLGPVDDYSTPASSPAGLQPDYAEAASRSSDALVSAAQLGASSPMAMMQGALETARTFAAIRKDNSQSAEMSESARVKRLNADYLAETFKDQVLKARLENDFLFEQTNQVIEQSSLIAENKRLSSQQRKEIVQNMKFAQELQESKVALLKSQIAETDAHKESLDTATKLTKAELDQLLPERIKSLKAQTAEAYSSANLSNTSARRIRTLLPYERMQMSDLVTSIKMAAKDASLIHDENIVKHNAFMGMIGQYSDSLAAKYKLDRQTANWYAVNQFVDIGQSIIHDAALIYGASKVGTAGNAVANSRPAVVDPRSSLGQNTLKQAGYVQPPTW